MRKPLRGSFLGQCVWIVAFAVVTLRTMAFGAPTDTCQAPSPPVITGSAKGVCRGTSVTLSASGCAGAVVWSNGQTGDQIVILPQQTTRYTAICRLRPGCISCFADVWTVTVNTPNAPVLSPSMVLACPGDNVTLTAGHCAGTIRWSDGAIGLVRNVKSVESTTYRAVCEQQGCNSNPSGMAAVQVVTPQIPVITIDKKAICAGQSVQLTANNCLGVVRWSDGQTGRVRPATPYQTTAYRAVCAIGSCRSDSSDAVPVTVHSSGQRLAVAPTLTNGCPFQTADLTRALPDLSDAPVQYVFRTGPSPNAPVVQSPTAVRAGTFYVQGRDVAGCYTETVAVTVRIDPCANAVLPCLSDPATVAVRLDSLDWAGGVVRLRGRLGGSVERAAWQSSGGGLFADAGLEARYLLSETDRQRGSVRFTLTAPDPDGPGPCAGASAQLVVAAPVASSERIGLSKDAAEPVWVTEDGRQLIQLTYRLTVVNTGRNHLRQVQVSDDLAAAFAATGARVHSVSVRTDGDFIANPSYTGRGADTTLLLRESKLPFDSTAHIDLTVWLDVSAADSLTFINQAHAQALDVNGKLCHDRSTDGPSVDPDHNGDPTDNHEPTRVTLRLPRPPDEGQSVFIPEGFSPNGDGINDRFVIRGLPAGTTVALEVYNRWGHRVYQSPNYQNDWDGTSNEGDRAAGSKQGLPDGTYYYQIRLDDGREFARFLTIAR